MLKRRIRGIALFIINHFLIGNHFWWLKRFLLNSTGCVVGQNTKIVGPIKMGVCADISIGKNCWIGENLHIYGNDKIIIGDNCDIAPNVCFATGTHKIGTHNRRAGEGYCSPISVGSGCWIGINSTFLANVNIDNGCIIAAGAIVTHSFQQNCIIAGIPAEVIKKLDDGELIYEN